MNKGKDPKVKKTFVRNCEQKIRPTTRKQVVRDVEAGSSNFIPETLQQKANELDRPTLCSSEALAHYLGNVKSSLPAPLSTDCHVAKSQLSSEMTKKLNFHFNDRIYRNLVELNATIEDLRTKKDKRLASITSSIKKDLEPNIEDFCDDEKETDTPPKIPVIKPKFRPVKTIEDGQLHKLIGLFEVL